MHFYAKSVQNPVKQKSAVWCYTGFRFRNRIHNEGRDDCEGCSYLGEGAPEHRRGSCLHEYRNQEAPPSRRNIVLPTSNTTTFYAGCLFHPARRLNASMRWHRQVKATQQMDKQTSNNVRLFGVGSTMADKEKNSL